jgi:hypothetical protein
MKNRTFAALGLLALSFGLSLSLSAEDKAQSLLPLKRMTVGPFDNFQATVDENEAFLYYTRSENLSSQIMRLNLKTGLNDAITAKDADAKTPALSPDGKVLAINYFKNDAKGDICLMRVDEKEIECISKRGVVDHSPVWLGNDRLAYISSDDSGRQSQLQVYTSSKKASEVIYKGELYAPDLSPDGKTLVFKGRKNELVLYDLGSRKILRTLLVNLPGLTGPSRFSADGRYLYFAQYMLDSNRDLTIDGRDAAAIYRYDVSTSNSVKPIQITSLNQNCSFPYPSKQFLYMTCAFEGALDIYRGPLNGTVPSAWGFEDLEEGHKVARSYSDRILFLNHLHSRLFKISDENYEERLMQNFVYSSEFLPALYYIDNALAKTPGRNDLKAWQILFNAYSRWEVLPQKRNLGAFAEFIRDQRKLLGALPQSDYRTLTDAYLDFFSNQFASAESKVQNLQFPDDMGLYLHSRLAKLSLKDRYSKFLENRVLAVEATEENRLYFLSLWLSELPASDPTAAVNALKAKVKAPAIELLDNELDLYKLVQSKEKKDILVHYRSIVNRVKRLKDDYFAMRLLFNRSIVVLYKNKRSRDMADIVSLWLSYLQRESKEFPYAVEAMRQNSLDLAYQFYHAKGPEKNFAIGAFFDSIRISDDLESHFQHTLLNFDKWPELTKNYDTMISQGLIKAESKVFIETIRAIVKPTKTLEPKDYAEAAKAIEGVDDSHLGSGVKYLFLGYLYQKQLDFTVKGFQYDADLAEKAHKAYLFAIDGALQNDRVQAAALQNLGILHLRIRNYTLASEFLTQRGNIAYFSNDEELAVLWLKAKALYLSYRSMDAYQAMKQALSLNPQPLTAFQEKAAFYAWNAGENEAAEALFKALPPEVFTPSIRLGYAHALVAQRKGAEAESQLLPILEAIPSTTKIIDADAAALKLQPLKLRFVALGLMAQAVGISDAKKVKALEERLALFPKIVDNAKNLHFQPETLSDQKVKETQDLAILYLKQGQQDKAIGALNRSLDEGEAHGKEFGYLNNTIVSVLKNAWMMSVNIPSSKEKSHALVAKLDKEFNEQKAFTPLVTQKWAELKLIQAAFLDKDFDKASSELWKTKAIEALKADKPEIFQNLGRYRFEIGKDKLAAG